MVDIFGMTIKVISRPFNIELLQLRHFGALIHLLLDMVSLMQTLFKTGFCISRLQKSLIEFLNVCCTLFVVYSFYDLQGHFKVI